MPYTVEQLKELHDQAQRFENLQKSLLKTPGQAFYVFHYPTQRFLIGEEENAALYGYTAEEIRALPEGWMSTHHPADLEKIVAQTEAFRNSSPRARPSKFQLRVLRKDGTYDWIALHRKALERDAEGKVTTEFGVARIITREMEAIRDRRESEERYRALFDEAPTAILLADSSGLILDANRSAYQDLRVREGALCGRNLDQVVAHVDRTSLRAVMRNLKGPQPLERETLITRFGRDDGTSYPVELIFSALPEGNIRVTTRDLSDRKLQEEALRQKEECYRGLFVENSLGVAVVDYRGQFLDVNPALADMIGLSRDDFVSLTLPDIVAGPSRMRSNQLLRSIKRGEPATVPVELELVVHGTGKVSFVDVILTVLEGEGSGKTNRGILIFRDIQDQKITEDALQRESSLNRVLLDNAPIAVGLLGPDGEVIRLNQTAEELFGYRTAEVKGKILWDLPIMDADEILKSKRRFKQLADGAKSVHAALTIRNRAGELRIVDAHTTAIRTHGNIDFLITTGVDNTNRRRLESEVIRVAESEQIRIGHDLHDGVGQTLTGIGVLIGALEESLEGNSKKEACRIRELVSQAIAENRRISHGLSPAAVKNRGLSGGLKLLAETIRTTFRTDCECEIDPKVGWLEEEHAIHAYRIAQEAVNNALRHGLATAIRLRLVLREPGRCGLEISDNGSGFKSSILKRGDGIGVRVMRYRADLVGGELHLRSSPGKGTRIILEMACGKPRNGGLTSENGGLQ